MWISRKKYNAVKEASEQLLKTLEELKTRPYLIGIERSGRLNKFTFCRGEELYVVETMGLISDPVKEWKEKLLR